MAVVREDVVKIGFEVDSKALNKVDDGIDGVIKNAQKAAGSDGVGKISDGLDDAAKSAKKFGDTDMGTLSKGVEKVGDGASDAGDGLDNAAKAAKKFGESDTDPVKKGVDETSEGAEEAEDGFKDAAKAAKKFGDTNLNKLSDGIDKIVSGVGKFTLAAGKTAIKGITVGAVAGTTALAALGTAAVKGYAEYEQLVGGVDTLFGSGTQSVEDYTASIGSSVEEIKKFQKANGLVVDGIIGPKTSAAISASYQKMAQGSTSAAETVLKNANNAYKTAGMSANDYMSNVTSFSASLINSVGGDTQKAAKLADQAMIDISDNANKMGTDMESVIGTYQSLARGNFGMLDNLKLGYGGTKAEMERLLKDAEKLTGKKFDISNFADITEAIHAIQTEMGITGTTAKEASETIQGSAMAMKAAWSNFLTGMANEDADFDQLLDNLVDSVKTFLKNIIPRIKKMLPRLVKGLTEIAKAIGKELPGILEELVPSLVEGGLSLLGSLYDVLRSNVGTFKNIGLSLVKMLYKGITGKEMPTEMFDKLKQKLDEVFGAISNIVSGVADFGRELLTVVGPALVWIADLALDAFVWIGDNINWLLPVLSSLLGAMLAFKAVRRVSGIVSGFMGLFGKKTALGGGGSGSDGGGLLGGGGGLFSMKPGQILKGIANISIIVIGLGALAALVMWAAPYMAELTDAGSLAKVAAAIVGVGLVGSVMGKVAGWVGNVPVGTVAKGLANIAIIMVGLGALAALLLWVAPYINQLGDTGSFLKLLVVITGVGLVGSALSLLAGIVGLIPFPVVLMGLANIATTLAAFTAVVAAYAALALIPGFNDFLNSGGEVLTTLCNILGEMVGSVIGGIGEGITNSLPKIGENISAFATSLQPMFDTLSGVDTGGISSFAAALAAFIAVIAGEKIVSIITGGIDYEGLGTKLSGMATNLSGFFSTIMAFPEGGFEKASALFECLAGIKSLPQDGGVVGWFMGEVDYSKMATGLLQLANTVSFFTAIQNIPEAAFATATKLFECLAGIKSLPQDGGVVGWFMGEVDFSKIASGIQTLAGAGMISALTAIAGIPQTSFDSLSAMFTALAGIKQMPKEGGVVSWFAGDNSTGLTSVASQLPGVATNIASFFANLGGITDFTPIKSLFDTIGNIDINADAASKGFLGLGTSDFEALGSGLSSFATNASTFFDTVQSVDADSISNYWTAIGEGGGLPEKLAGLDGTIGTTMSNIATNVQTNMDTIKTTLDTGFNAAVAAIALKQTGFFNAGVAIMQGLNSGILNMEGAVMATVNRIASKIQSTFNSAMKIHSPSKVMEASGEYSGLGAVKGLLNMIPQVQAATTKVASAMIPYGGTYTPESSATTFNNGGNSEITTISPVFNLTISGSQDDRSLARRVKQYVASAIEETFESMERKTYAIREV